jgi:broad specificity phosphatase PhoE
MLLIRHAQSEFNAVFNRTREDPGIHDPRLTEEGRRQARLAAEALSGAGIARLVASPYTRALETAAIIAERHGLPIAVDARIGERAAFACDVGTPLAQLRRRWPRLALDHLDEIWWPALEESETALGRRCEAFRSEIAAHPDWAGFAVVSHWGFIRCLTGITVENGTALRVDPRQPRAAVSVPMAPPAAPPAGR